MHPELIYTDTDTDSHHDADRWRRARRNTFSEAPPSPTWTFFNKLWKHRKQSSHCKKDILTVPEDRISSAEERSPSPLSFRKNRSRRISASQENNNENLLHYAVSNQEIYTLDKLFSDSSEHVEINYMRPPGVSALHQACVFGNLNIVKILVENGADINMKTWSKLSPVKIATLSGNYEVAQFLVENGANSDDIINGFQADVEH